jgi:hypothetical protein
MDPSDSWRRICFIFSSKETYTHTIALAVRTKRKTLEKNRFTKFKIFEEFCKLELNKYEETNAIPRLSAPIKTNLILEIERAAESKISNLLLNTGFEL